MTFKCLSWVCTVLPVNPSGRLTTKTQVVQLATARCGCVGPQQHAASHRFPRTDTFAPCEGAAPADVVNASGAEGDVDLVSV